MVEHQFSKLIAPVRFRYPAQNENRHGAFGAVSVFCTKTGYLTASFNAFAARNFAVREAAI